MRTIYTTKYIYVYINVQRYIHTEIGELGIIDDN